MPKVSVLGAGVVGLAVGVRLLEELPDIEVTVHADLTGDATTSRGSGGLWWPYSLGDTPGDLVLRWGRDTFQHLLNLFNSPDGANAGTQLVSGYQLWQNVEADPTWKETALSFRHLSHRELEGFSSYLWKHGWKWTTIITDMHMYMQYLLHRFLKAGGTLCKGTVRHLSELADCDVLVNCGGLRGGQLFGDKTVKAVRGQVIRVRAPWVKHFYISDSKYYVLPQVDTVVLGGTTQKGDWNTSISEEDKSEIIKNVCKMVPSLKDAEVVQDWAGLRPYREPVRLELHHHRVQLASGGDKSLPVIHNYGHGGSGVTLHWGCAADAVKLVSQQIGKDVQESHPAAKL